MQRASELPGVSIFSALINNKIIDCARVAMKELYKIALAENNLVCHQHKEHRY